MSGYPTVMRLALTHSNDSTAWPEWWHVQNSLMAELRDAPLTIFRASPYSRPPNARGDYDGWLWVLWDRKQHTRIFEDANLNAVCWRAIEELPRR